MNTRGPSFRSRSSSFFNVVATNPLQKSSGSPAWIPSNPMWPGIQGIYERAEHVQNVKAFQLTYGVYCCLKYTSGLTHWFKARFSWINDSDARSIYCECYFSEWSSNLLVWAICHCRTLTVCLVTPSYIELIAKNKNIVVMLSLGIIYLAYRLDGTSTFLRLRLFSLLTLL